MHWRTCPRSAARALYTVAPYNVLALAYSDRRIRKLPHGCYIISGRVHYLRPSQLGRLGVVVATFDQQPDLCSSSATAATGASGRHFLQAGLAGTELLPGGGFTVLVRRPYGSCTTSSDVKFHRHLLSRPETELRGKGRRRLSTRYALCRL